MFGWLKKSKSVVRFKQKSIDDVENSDFAEEAVVHLALVNRQAIPQIERMLETALVRGARACALAHRKSDEQLSVLEKRKLGVRANAFLSKQAYSELTPEGLVRPLDAHEATLLRAIFNKSKVTTIKKCLSIGCNEVRFSSSHVGECEFCDTNDDKIFDVSYFSHLPIVACQRETCSALLMPHVNFLDEKN